MSTRPHAQTTPTSGLSSFTVLTGPRRRRRRVTPGSGPGSLLAVVVAVLVAVGAVLAFISALALPAEAQAATCSDYRTQADAQRAADTRDGDGDGIYCESLPCPCAGPGSAGDGGDAARSQPQTPSCTRVRGIVTLSFSAREYPGIKRHFQRAVSRDWPRTMVLNRRGADERRDRLMRGRAAKSGHDRDEYPAAVLRGRADGKLRGLVRGTDPRGWRASVAYVPSSENRSHGASMGNKLRRFCDGTRVRYRFR